MRAFSLVEIMVVVVIIGMLATLAVPTYRHITLRAKATAVATDLRAYSAVLTHYNLSKGAWPSSAQPGAIPVEVADSMPGSYTHPTPIGGYYQFDHNNAGNGLGTLTAAITITSANGSLLTDDLDLVEMIDTVMDDGNTATGSLRLSPTHNLVYIIEP